MRKAIKSLIGATMIVAVLASMQISAFATVNGTSSEANNLTAASAREASSQNTLDERATPQVNEIPNTGMESLAIPAAVALIAAGTAAVALTGKKKK